MIIPYTDLLFFDLKVMEDEAAVKLTGQDTSHIFESLEWIKSYNLAHNKPELQFRTPIIPGSTDSTKNMKAIATKIRNEYAGLFTEWELNLFNDICEDKYQRLNKTWHYTGISFDNSAYSKVDRFREDNLDLKIKISGFYQKK